MCGRVKEERRFVVQKIVYASKYPVAVLSLLATKSIYVFVRSPFTIRGDPRASSSFLRRSEFPYLPSNNLNGRARTETAVVGRPEGSRMPKAEGESLDRLLDAGILGSVPAPDKTLHRISLQGCAGACAPVDTSAGRIQSRN